MEEKELMTDVLCIQYKYTANVKQYRNSEMNNKFLRFG